VDSKIGTSSAGGLALVLAGVLLAAGNTLLIVTLQGSGVQGISTRMHAPLQTGWSGGTLRMPC
jgi:hypothetical protein